MTETTYTLRTLEAADVFIMSKIIHAIGVEEFKKCFQPEVIKKMMEQDKAAEAVGFEIFFDIVF